MEAKPVTRPDYPPPPPPNSSGVRASPWPLGPIPTLERASLLPPPNWMPPSRLSEPHLPPQPKPSGVQPPPRPKSQKPTLEPPPPQPKPSDVQPPPRPKSQKPTLEPPPPPLPPRSSKPMFQREDTRKHLVSPSQEEKEKLSEEIIVDYQEAIKIGNLIFYCLDVMARMHGMCLEKPELIADPTIVAIKNAIRQRSQEFSTQLCELKKMINLKRNRLSSLA